VDFGNKMGKYCNPENLPESSFKKGGNLHPLFTRKTMILPFNKGESEGILVMRK